MTNEVLMTTDTLFKYAALDALGLLDAIESDYYNRSFNEAPLDVQDEIREIQTSYAIDPLFQATEEPAGALRRRVLDHVLDTYAREEAEKHTPVGSIGRNTPTSISPSEHAKVSRTLRVWRAATFALAASLLFGVFMYFNTISTSNELGLAALNSNTEDKLRELIGPTYEEFAANPNVIHSSLKPAETSIPGSATVYVNPQTEQGFMLAVDLEQGQQYVLQMRVDDEIVHEVLAFKVTSVYTGRRIESLDPSDFDISSFANVSWEIVNQETGDVILLA